MSYKDIEENKGGSWLGQKIKIDDIISFEMTIRLNYKNCEVTVKRFGKILDLTIVNISNKGYFIKRNKTFICDSTVKDLLHYLNGSLHYIDDIYDNLIEEDARNDDKIRDFEEYEK